MVASPVSNTAAGGTTLTRLVALTCGFSAVTPDEAMRAAPFEEVATSDRKMTSRRRKSKVLDVVQPQGHFLLIPWWSHVQSGSP